MLYEMQTIGQFMAQMGHRLGCDQRRLSVQVNLLQQTRLDPALGDLQLADTTQDKYVMLEFKAFNCEEEVKSPIRNHVNQQVKKLVSPLRQNSIGQSELRKISIKCHWMVHGVDPAIRVDATFLPYILDIAPGVRSLVGAELKIYSSIDKFLEHLFLIGYDHLGATKTEFQQYLDYITPMPSANKSADDRYWLMMKVSPIGVTWSVETIKTALMGGVPRY